MFNVYTIAAIIVARFVFLNALEKKFKQENVTTVSEQNNSNFKRTDDTYYLLPGVTNLLKVTRNFRFKRGAPDSSDAKQNYFSGINSNLSNNLSPTTRDAPKYMLDIFRQFTNNPFTKPASNIIRSFFNEGTIA